MIKFTVTVRTDFTSVQYTALARSSFDLVESAIDKFGPCRVTVRVA